MSENVRHVIDNDDREFFTSHYMAIAERLAKKRLWRGPWRVEIEGCVFKFKVEGYAKKHSAIWVEQEQERASSEERMSE